MINVRRAAVLALCACLVGASALLVAPAEAKVARAITIAVSPNGGLAGTQVTFSGKLTKSPKGSAVKIQRKVAGQWKLAKATATKTAAGAYSTKVTMPSKPGYYLYRSYAPATSSKKAAYSKVLSVASLHRSTFYKSSLCSCVIIPPAPGQVSEDGPMTLGGSVNKPFSVGAVVVLQRKVGTSWVTKGSGKLDTYGRFIATDPHTTSATYRFVLSRKGLNSGAVTPTFEVVTKL